MCRAVWRPRGVYPLRVYATTFTVKSERGEFPMKSLLVSGTALTTLRKIAFTLLFCTVLMVFAAVAQNNQGPPAGAILNLAGTPIPGGGDGTYQYYSVPFVASLANTAITFAIREDPAYISLANVVVTDGDGNSLFNGDFSGGPVGSNTPNGWTYANIYGASAGGVVQSGANYCYNTYPFCWYDGAVQAYDAISQTIQTNVGTTYTISFYLADNSHCGTCNFSDVSTNSQPGINVTVYAQLGLPSPNTLTLTEAGQGYGAVIDNSSPTPMIDCTDTNGTVSGTCSATYANGTPVTLTATLNSGSTTFGGWGGACASSGMNLTCSLTMNSSQNVTAVFNETGSPTQSGNINPGNPEGPGPTTTFTYNGGFKEGSPTSGYDFTAQQTDTTQTLLMSVTAIPINQASCNALVRLNPSFNTAECFVILNGGGLGVDSPVMYEVTCQNGSCGSNSNPFDAILGSDFNFNCSENAPLLCGPPPYFPSSFGPPNLTSIDGLPAVGFLKGTGPDEIHPCTPYPGNFPPLFQSNQIVSFTVGDTSSKPIKGASGGSTSCWLATYLTPGEVPTVTVTQPLNNGIYQLNQVTSANYACAAVNNGNAAAGPYLTVPPGSCTATDTPGGPVANGAQFDTSTTGPHTFTANVEDSALNTAASTVIYNVLGPPAVKSANYTTFMEGTPGSFTITTSGYPYPAISYSPYGSLPAGVSLVDNHNGTATLSGTPTVSGVFTFWITAASGSTRTVQSFTLTVTAPLSVTPTSLAFGSVTVGQLSKKSVTVQNNSGKSVGIGPVTFTVTVGAKSQFTLGQTCPANLPAGNSCTIGVNFTPNAKGADAATLNIVTTAPGSPLKIPITAAGK